MTAPRICLSCPFRLGIGKERWHGDFVRLISPGSIADAEEVREFARNLPREDIRSRVGHTLDPETFAEQRVKALLDFPPDGRDHLMLVLRMPCGLISGTCHAYRSVTDSGTYCFHEISEFTWHELHGHGAGHALLAALIAQAQQAGADVVRTLYIDTDAQNVAMQKVARDNGFVHQGINAARSTWLRPM